ncbi:MAG: DUF3422 domain-containing protein [Paracoccus sp. (in: a-proteobacteria)]|nr:DUF3422 domain-containing protein [Paracoccus sp. (in: a-proteobacteria)]
MSTVPGLPMRPFDPSTASIFPEAWQDAAPGRRIAAALVQIDLLPDDPAEIPDRIADWFAAESLAAVWVLEKSAVIASDFRIDSAGWMRFAVFVKPGVEPSRLGRLIHRVLELETYRTVSMLGLGRARALTARLNALEVRLSALIESMADESRAAEEVLHDMLPIVTELEAQAAQHGFRFGATRAYQAIVSDRIEMLRETRFLQMQMLSEFMRRRYLPAMRTTESAAARLAEMMARATRSGELLRTRVEVERRAQNQKIMERMDRRAEMQLRLQHTVEGLSVVAISYYAVGLLTYAIGPLASAAGIEKSVLVAAMTPVVVLVAWLGMRRLRHSLHAAGQGDL